MLSRGMLKKEFDLRHWGLNIVFTEQEIEGLLDTLMKYLSQCKDLMQIEDCYRFFIEYIVIDDDEFFYKPYDYMPTHVLVLPVKNLGKIKKIVVLAECGGKTMHTHIDVLITVSKGE